MSAATHAAAHGSAQEVSWVSLNAGDEETRLVAVQLPSGTKRLVLVEGQELAPQQVGALAAMGFKRTASGVLVRDDLRFSLSELRKAFPLAVPVRMPMSAVTRISATKP